MSKRLRAFLRKFGPGFISGVSDDDPSGIATYSQAGAQYGTAMLFLAFLAFPLMAAIQEICARVGRVTGHGVAANIRRYYSRWLLYFTVSLLLVSNIINIGADIGAMAAALELLTGKDRFHLFPILFGTVSLLAEVFLSYRPYTTALKWISLSLLSYAAVLLFIDIPWAAVLRDIVLPRIEPSADYMQILVAVLGTTISPYLLFWQSSTEVEEQQATPGEAPLKRAPRQARSQFEKIRFDTYSGMAVATALMFFIILTSALTLHAHGITQIATAAQAAEALRPFAGELAFLLFAAGIVGSGLLAVPVLAGSAAYAMSEAFQWRTGLDRKPAEAKEFYSIIALATLGGTALNFIGIDPIKALVWSAMINGFISVPILFVLLSMAGSARIMGKFVIPWKLRIAGWVTTAAMAAAAAFLLLHPG